MNAVLSEYEQGTEEWKIERIPYVTASDVAKVMAKTKSGYGAQRQNLMVKMASEILLGRALNGFKNDHMQNGNDLENLARLTYQEITGTEVRQVGLAMLPDEMLAASIDGEIVGTDGTLEIKNVIPAEQVRLLLTEKIPDGYVKQMQTGLYVWDKKWCDYMSQSIGDEEYGELPDHMKIKIIRVERDEAMISDIRQEVAKFHKELNQLLVKLRKI